ncbi:aminomethyltransferase [Hydrogenispora ethanolica]|uniref:Aminomethyltransferase n=1 Tax=Hydrogenispora ethanolica TaxID=1082276 RepID=A0A4R1SCI6_HYDET|nr:glycine cleavage system aminomethyltransferase GcvT [Hydrogenispora ethanolica]TCL76312.1 aminomethyltransferase [Hydrogenispora ethanolica]
MKTPLFPVYARHHAKVVDFHGWDLPVQFSGIIDEHRQVRQSVGLFDVSHMGEFKVSGADAAAFLDRMVTNRIATLQPGAIRYSPLCYEDGGTVDDLLIYRLTETDFLVVVNASNIEKDFDWLVAHRSRHRVSIENISTQTAQLAIQGPKAQLLMEQILHQPLDSLRYYHFIAEARLAQFPVLISRTGYTGEDGFEIYLGAQNAVRAWEILMDEGASFGIKPIGLGARDTLRFEAGLPLYGQELSAEINPLEAGLSRFVKFEKPEFIGKDALAAIQASGGFRKLIGLSMVDRGIPRSGFRVFQEDLPVGWVTSGSYAPTLDQNLAIALVEHSSDLTDPFQIEIRGKLLTARFLSLPFYSRSKGAAQ